jgi:hypothetical protein
LSICARALWLLRLDTTRHFHVTNLTHPGVSARTPYGAAEHPGAIRNCFLNTEYTDRGKYSLRLWDGRAGKWLTVGLFKSNPAVTRRLKAPGFNP